MKKHIFLAVVAVAVISASCRKDRTCTCNWTSTDVNTVTFNGSSTTQTNATSGSSKTTMTKVHKKNARQGCLNYTESYTTSSGSGSYTNSDAVTNEVSGCKLK